MGILWPQAVWEFCNLCYIFEQFTVKAQQPLYGGDLQLYLCGPLSWVEGNFFWNVGLSAWNFGMEQIFYLWWSHGVTHSICRQYLASCKSYSSCLVALDQSVCHHQWRWYESYLCFCWTLWTQFWTSLCLNYHSLLQIYILFLTLLNRSDQFYAYISLICNLFAQIHVLCWLFAYVR